MLKVRSGGREEIPLIQGKEQRLCRCRRAKRSYIPFKVRRGGREETSLVQGKEQQLHFAEAAVKRYPTAKKRNPSKMVGVAREHQREDIQKP